MWRLPGDGLEARQFLDSRLRGGSDAGSVDDVGNLIGGPKGADYRLLVRGTHERLAEFKRRHEVREAQRGPELEASFESPGDFEDHRRRVENTHAQLGRFLSRFEGAGSPIRETRHHSPETHTSHPKNGPDRGRGPGGNSAAHWPSAIPSSHGPAVSGQPRSPGIHERGVRRSEAEHRIMEEIRALEAALAHHPQSEPQRGTSPPRMAPAAHQPRHEDEWRRRSVTFADEAGHPAGSRNLARLHSDAQLDADLEAARAELLRDRLENVSASLDERERRARSAPRARPSFEAAFPNLDGPTPRGRPSYADDAELLASARRAAARNVQGVVPPPRPGVRRTLGATLSRALRAISPGAYRAFAGENVHACLPGLEHSHRLRGRSSDYLVSEPALDAQRDPEAQRGRNPQQRDRPAWRGPQWQPPKLRSGLAPTAPPQAPILEPALAPLSEIRQRSGAPRPASVGEEFRPLDEDRATVGSRVAVAAAGGPVPKSVIEGRLAELRRALGRTAYGYVPPPPPAELRALLPDGALYMPGLTAVSEDVPPRPSAAFAHATSPSFGAAYSPYEQPQGPSASPPSASPPTALLPIGGGVSAFEFGSVPSPARPELRSSPAMAAPAPGPLQGARLFPTFVPAPATLVPVCIPGPAPPSGDRGRAARRAARGGPSPPTSCSSESDSSEESSGSGSEASYGSSSTATSSGGKPRKQPHRGARRSGSVATAADGVGSAGGELAADPASRLPSATPSRLPSAPQSARSQRRDSRAPSTGGSGADAGLADAQRVQFAEAAAETEELADAYEALKTPLSKLGYGPPRGRPSPTELRAMAAKLERDLDAAAELEARARAAGPVLTYEERRMVDKERRFDMGGRFVAFLSVVLALAGLGVVVALAIDQF
eukprot:tig00000383_g24657.t1